LFSFWGIMVVAAFAVAMGLGWFFGYRNGFSQGLEEILDLNRRMEKNREPEGEPLALGDVFRGILEANITRNFANFHRRTIKLMEELGELSEAYLNVTSASNGKGLSYFDIREEAVDCVIVAVDLALTPTPDQDDMSTEEVVKAMTTMISLKLAKWKKNRDTGKAATDAE